MKVCILLQSRIGEGAISIKLTAVKIDISNAMYGFEVGISTIELRERKLSIFHKCGIIKSCKFIKPDTFKIGYTIEIGKIKISAIRKARHIEACFSQETSRIKICRRQEFCFIENSIFLECSILEIHISIKRYPFAAYIIPEY